MNWRREQFYFGFVVGLIVGLLVGVIAQQAHAAELAIGDSLAVGIAAESHETGYAKVGLSPKGVVDIIGRTPLNDLHGNIVILSTGYSNSPMERSTNVELELDMLQAAGAKVVILGVGIEVKGSLEINQWLQGQAKYRGWVYIDGWQRVHPNYKKLRENIDMFECLAHWQCGA